MANLEQSGCRISEAWSVILKFLLTGTLSLTKTESRTYKHSSHTIALSKGTIFAKKSCFFERKC